MIDDRRAYLHDTIYHATSIRRKTLLLKFGKCYHFVIIVIDNIFYDGCTSWCLFLSFFWSPKMTFSHPLFSVTIMLSVFYYYYIK
jgi:hypothetical protein